MTFPCYKRHHEYRYDSDEQTGQHECKAVARCYCLNECRTRFDAHAGQEQRNAYLAQHHQSARLGICYKTQLVSESAYQYCHHKRTAGQTKFKRSGNTRNCYWNASEQNTHKNTYEQGCQIGSIQTFHLIAHTLCHCCHAARLTYHRQAVAYLKYQAGRCKQLRA